MTALSGKDILGVIQFYNKLRGETEFVWLGDLAGFTVETCHEDHWYRTQSCGSKSETTDHWYLTHRCGWKSETHAGPKYLANLLSVDMKHDCRNSHES